MPPLGNLPNGNRSLASSFFIGWHIRYSERWFLSQAIHFSPIYRRVKKELPHFPKNEERLMSMLRDTASERHTNCMAPTSHFSLPINFRCLSIVLLDTPIFLQILTPLYLSSAYLAIWWSLPITDLCSSTYSEPKFSPPQRNFMNQSCALCTSTDPHQTLPPSIPSPYCPNGSHKVKMSKNTVFTCSLLLPEKILKNQNFTKVFLPNDATNYDD